MPEIRSERNRCLSFLLLALLFFAPVSVHAEPLSSAAYQNQLQRAIKALEDLDEIDESEYPDTYQEQFEQALKTVAEAVPESETVKASDDVCNVDNSWLTIALKDLKNSTPEQRTTRLPQLIERLKAIEERVGYERQATAADTKTQSKQKLDRILARPEYVTKAAGPNALSRLIAEFIRWIIEHLPQRLPIHAGGGRWLTFVAEGLVVLVALVVLFYVLKILLARFQVLGKRRAKKKKREARIVLGERLEPEQTAGDLLSEAEALARRGDIRAAIRKTYIALLVELGDRKVLTLAQNKTNRDYLNAVRNIPLLHPTMRTLTESFERHWYGFVDATDSDWQNFRASYQVARQTQN